MGGAGGAGGAGGGGGGVAFTTLGGAGGGGGNSLSDLSWAIAAVVRQAAASRKNSFFINGVCRESKRGGIFHKENVKMCKYADVQMWGSLRDRRIEAQRHEITKEYKYKFAAIAGFY